MEEDEEKLTDGEYYNFFLAQEEYGFDYESFIKDGFKNFLEDTFIKDLIDLRKSYISRNYMQVRFIAHKFKGSFKYNIKLNCRLMYGFYISNTCYEIQEKLDNGSISIEELYVELVKRFNYFLAKLEEFAERIGNNIKITN